MIEGQIKLFDTHPEDGSTRHRFTLAISKARIASIQSHLLDSLDPATSGRPAVETIELVPHMISYTDEVYSTEFTDEAAPLR